MAGDYLKVQPVTKEVIAGMSCPPLGLAGWTKEYFGKQFRLVTDMNKTHPSSSQLKFGNLEKKNLQHSCEHKTVCLNMIVVRSGNIWDL